MVQDIGDRRATNTVLLAGQAVDRATVQGLKTASAKSGVSFQFLVAKAAQESSLDTTAKADTSSATGLFQFTRGTWLDMVKRYGSQYGFADLSRQILETPSGKLTVTDAAAEKRILALRQDPETSGLMAAEFARDNAAALEGALGRVPDAADLYLAHFMGANGAVTLLSAAPGRDASDVVPAAARSNPAVFLAADGEPRSVADVVKLIRDRFANQMNRYASADTVMSDAAPVMPAPAAPAYVPPVAPSAPALNSPMDFRPALGGNSERSPVSAMIMDQLMRLIASDPMMPAAEEEEDEDGLNRPLGSGGFRGTDWANAMSRSVTPQMMAQGTPQPQPAARAYNDADAAPPSRALNDTI